jgi:phage anti-repressor protein
MEEFLKKYSSVPIGFIEDFFDISKESYDDAECIIKFDVVVKWLDVRKDNLKAILIEHFEEKYDYTIEKVKIKNKNGNGANWVDLIHITPDCFKSLCMLSQTAKAKEVRKYFLSIEKLVIKYNKYIQETLEKKIGIIKKNQKPKIDIKSGVIYISEAQNNDDDLIKYKIGKTINIKNRNNTYNSGNAHDIEPLFILEVDHIDQVEKCIKNLLKKYQYRKKKEIYEVNIDIIRHACAVCNEFTQGFTKYINNQKTKKEITEMNKKFKKIKITENSLIIEFKKK